jgi:hypothetical protein
MDAILLTITTRGMPTRRGRSISGAPKSVRSNLIKEPVLPEILLIDFKKYISRIDFDLKNADRFRNENRSPIFPEWFSIAIVIAICT